MDRKRRLGKQQAPPGEETKLVIVRDEPPALAGCQLGREIQRYVLREPGRERFITDLVGVDRGLLKRWMKGERVPRPDNLLRLAEAAFVDPEEYEADHLRTPWSLFHTLQQAIDEDEARRAYEKVFEVSLRDDDAELSEFFIHSNWNTKR